MLKSFGKSALLLSSCLTLAVGAPATAKPPTPPRPNVVVILADDMGYGDPSLYGSKLIQTRAIDSIGREGVTFTDGYVTAPLCSPSRAGLLTGRYQQRFGFEQQISNGAMPELSEVREEDGTLAPIQGEAEFLRRGVPVTEKNMGEIFKAGGYRTAVIGKWHLGNGEQFLPNNRGFDHSFVFYGNTSLQSKNLSDPDLISLKVDYHDELPNVAWTREGLNAVRRNGQIVNVEDFLLFRFRDEAVQFIEDNKSKPFFLYLPLNAPQPPLQVPSSYFEKLRPDIRNIAQRAYNGLLMAEDDVVSAVLDKLKSSGLDKNTIVVFISDNGSVISRPGRNAPFSGGKTSTYEGGIRVPYVMKWPGQIPAGEVYRKPVSSLDLLPTLAAATGVALPKDKALDGVDLLPYLKGANDGAPHDILYWKLGPESAVRKGKWKLWIDNRGGTTRLFDLQRDPAEQQDLAAAEPAVRAELKAAYDAWNSSLPPRSWTTVSPAPRRAAK
ncbi:sulfatase-like hydrolase/transferase [Phenylobacterium sp.]|uniref:sulfatase-like hydrolase/transferase n=1 Tax=Phenylobacterium sp. TaxID=1871053 RepID=UPI0025F63B39|nr:sulfatase-like hydrolase/transferase [Phenylobacterium sp.]